eukprot:Em0006g1575a
MASYNADTTIKDKDKNTAFDLMVKEYQKELFLLLLKTSTGAQVQRTKIYTVAELKLLTTQKRVEDRATTAERRAIIAEERAATAEETASVLEKTAASAEERAIGAEKRATRCEDSPPVTPTGTALQLEHGVGHHQCCSQPAQHEEDSPPRGPPDPESDTDDIVISVFINKIINPDKSFGSSDPMCILLLQLSSLQVEHTAPNIHDSNKPYGGAYSHSHIPQLSRMWAWVVAPGHKEHEEPLAVSISSHHWMENYSSLGSKFRSRLGVSADEMTFKGGELIVFKSRVSSDWLRGELLNGSEGIFPTNFVDNVVCIPRLQRVDQDWLRGRLGGKEGLFPAQFVEIKIDLPPPAVEVPPVSPVVSSSPVVPKAPSLTTTALYDFDGQDGELSFKGAEKEQDVDVVSTVPAEKVTVFGLVLYVSPSLFYGRGGLVLAMGAMWVVVAAVGALVSILLVPVVGLVVVAAVLLLLLVAAGAALLLLLLLLVAAGAVLLLLLLVLVAGAALLLLLLVAVGAVLLLLLLVAAGAALLLLLLVASAGAVLLLLLAVGAALLLLLLLLLLLAVGAALLIVVKSVKSSLFYIG